MRILNSTKRTQVARDALRCRSLTARAKGLMFSPKRAAVLIFPREERVELHMLFVFFPIDVIFLDGSKRAVEIWEELKPFSPVRRSAKAARYAVEVPAGTVRKSKTATGDLLKLKEA